MVTKLYIVELPDKTVRGALAVIPDIFKIFGYIITVSLGFCLRWYEISFVGISISIVAFIVVLFIPESPSYLVTTDREKEARKVLRALRGPDADLDEEIQIFHSKNTSLSKQSLLKIVKQTSIIKSLVVIQSLFVVRTLSGLVILEVNATRIFRNTVPNFDESLANVLLFLAMFIGSICSIFLLDRIGRRRSLILSLIIGAVSLMILGTYLCLKDYMGSSLTNDGITVTNYNTSTMMMNTTNKTSSFIGPTASTHFITHSLDTLVLRLVVQLFQG